MFQRDHIPWCTGDELTEEAAAVCGRCVCARGGGHLDRGFVGETRRQPWPLRHPTGRRGHGRGGCCGLALGPQPLDLRGGLAHSKAGAAGWTAHLAQKNLQVLPRHATANEVLLRQLL